MRPPLAGEVPPVTRVWPLNSVQVPAVCPVTSRVALWARLIRTSPVIDPDVVVPLLASARVELSPSWTIPKKLFSRWFRVRVVPAGGLTTSTTLVVSPVRNPEYVWVLWKLRTPVPSIDTSPLSVPAWTGPTPGSAVPTASRVAPPILTSCENVLFVFR